VAEERPRTRGHAARRSASSPWTSARTSSNLVITDGEKIIWQRPIPLGGNHLTRALSKEMKLTFAKAEHLKRNAAKSPPELKTILAALKPVLTDFVGEVQRVARVLHEHSPRGHDPLHGRPRQRLPIAGVAKVLAREVATRGPQAELVQPAGRRRRCNAPVFTENVLGFAVPYGLALQGVGQAKLHTNLLPQEIRFDRMIREKKPWAVAAASALFLGAGLLTLGYAINYRAVSAADIDKSIKSAEGKISEVTTVNGQATAKEGEVAKVTKEVTGVICRQGRAAQLAGFEPAYQCPAASAGRQQPEGEPAPDPILGQREGQGSPARIPGSSPRRSKGRSADA